MNPFLCVVLGIICPSTYFFHLHFLLLPASHYCLLTSLQCENGPMWLMAAPSKPHSFPSALHRSVSSPRFLSENLNITNRNTTLPSAHTCKSRLDCSCFIACAVPQHDDTQHPSSHLHKIHLNLHTPPGNLAHSSQHRHCIAAQLLTITMLIASSSVHRASHPQGKTHNVAHAHNFKRRHCILLTTITHAPERIHVAMTTVQHHSTTPLTAGLSFIKFWSARLHKCNTATVWLDTSRQQSGRHLVLHQ